MPIGSPDWLSCAQRQLEEELNVERRTQEEREQQLESCGETLQLLVDSIKTILSNHNRQLADVKHLLRAMAKVHLKLSYFTRLNIFAKKVLKNAAFVCFFLATGVKEKYKSKFKIKSLTQFLNPPQSAKSEG